MKKLVPLNQSTLRLWGSNWTFMCDINFCSSQCSWSV